VSGAEEEDLAAVHFAEGGERMKGHGSIMP
jgi:hypothetical protein